MKPNDFSDARVSVTGGADYVEAADLLPRLQSGALGKFNLVLHLGACSARRATGWT